MTLQEAKNEIAKKLQYNDWNEMINRFLQKGKIDWIEEKHNLAAELYTKKLNEELDFIEIVLSDKNKEIERLKEIVKAGEEVLKTQSLIIATDPKEWSDKIRSDYSEAIEKYSSIKYPKE